MEWTSTGPHNFTIKVPLSELPLCSIKLPERSRTSMKLFWALTTSKIRCVAKTDYYHIRMAWSKAFMRLSSDNTLYASSKTDSSLNIPNGYAIISIRHGTTETYNVISH